MTTTRTLREELEAAILERHCAHHPMTQKWARGELGRDALMGWGIEHYHWISNSGPGHLLHAGQRAAGRARALLDNYREENDPTARTADRAALRRGERREHRGGAARAAGCRPPRPWVACPQPPNTGRLDRRLCGHHHRHASRSRRCCTARCYPRCARSTGFAEYAIEHFWLHSDADEEHGGRAFELLERHCTTRALQDEAIHWARESARMRWFYFDGIYLHYELGYKLR